MVSWGSLCLRLVGPAGVCGAAGGVSSARGALAGRPVSLPLAREMMSRTRVWKQLLGYRDVPPADIDAIALTLVRLSQLVADVAARTLASASWLSLRPFKGATGEQAAEALLGPRDERRRARGRRCARGTAALRRPSA